MTIVCHVSLILWANYGLAYSIIRVVTGLLPILFLIAMVLNPGVANFKFDIFKGAEYLGAVEDPEAAAKADGTPPLIAEVNNYCSICGLHKAAGTKHCDIANVCIKSYKEYSSFIDKPLGSYNRLIHSLIFYLLFFNGGLVVILPLAKLLAGLLS